MNQNPADTLGEALVRNEPSNASLEVPSPNPDPRRIHAEKVKIIYTTAPLNMVATLVNSWILAYILWREGSHALIAAWVVAILVLTFFRYRSVIRYRKTETRIAEAEGWGRRFILGIAATGLLWGVGGAVLFPVHSIFHQAVLLLVFGGMIAGAVGAYSALEKVFLAYALPLLLPVTVRFLAQGAEVHFGIALLVTLFLLLMLGTSMRIHAIMSASILNRLRNQELVDRLTEEKRSVEEVNELLKEQIRERWNAEKELQQAREEVEHRVQERTQELVLAGRRLREEAEERERAVEEKNRIFNLSRDLIAIAGMDGYFKLVNPAWERTLGYSPEELCSRPFLDFIHPEDHKKNDEEVEKLSAGVPSLDFENRYLHRDGSVRFLSWTATPLLKEGLLYCVGRDVTHRRQFEDAMQKISRAAIDFVQLEPREDIYEFIATRLKELLPDTVVAVNAYDAGSGQLVTRHILGMEEPLLQRVGEMLGEAILGASFREIPEEIRALLFSGHLQELKNGLFEIFFGRVPAPLCREIEAMVGIRRSYSIGFRRGGKLFGNVSLFTLNDEAPNRETVETFVNQATIVLDRRKADEEVRTAAEQWRNTFNSISDAVSLMDMDGVILHSNRAMANFAGRSLEETVGHRCWELVHRTTGPIEGCPFVRMKRSRKKEQTVLPLDDRVLEVTVDPIFDENGEVAGAVHIVSDITERRRMEEEVAKAQKLESVGVLAGGIAHDFNNILAIIWGNVSLAKMALNPGEPAHQNLEQAEKGALRAKDLSQQLLTFSKGGAPVRKPTDIAVLLQDVALFTLSGSGVRCEFDFQEDLRETETDEGQIRQVLINLFLNAVQAMPDGGVVRVRAENAELCTPECRSLDPGTYVRILVQDQGIGIRKEHLSRVFDPYFTTKQQGNGLGLAVAYSVVTKHNGRISVESEPGTGSSFTVLLPASESGPAETVPQEEEVVGGRGRLLVMDDEELVLGIVKQMLEHLGYQVELAGDGTEAIELYARAMEAGKPYDAVIMDLTVPGGMGGQEAVGRLREMDPGIRAIVSSGYSSDPVLANHDQYGFSGMISKPYSMANLSRTLKKVLE